MTTGYTQVAEPIVGLGNDRLHLVEFKTARDRIECRRVSMLALYQWGDKTVIVLFHGIEPTFTLDRLMTIAQHLEHITVGIRFPVTWYIRKALCAYNKDLLSHASYVYGKCLPCQKKK